MDINENETRLQKDFKQRDIQRMRNIITKNYGDKTVTQSGYVKKSIERVNMNTIACLSYDFKQFKKASVNAFSRQTTNTNSCGSFDKPTKQAMGQVRLSRDSVGI